MIDPWISAELRSLEQELDYKFQTPALLQRALTHPSYVNEHPEEARDNQRLEFLGDAVIDFIAAAWVYRTYSDFAEGRMTRLRAALVRMETLARLADDLNMGEALRLGHGEEEAGGRIRKPNLCDAFEAVVGAIYLDGGMRAARSFVEPLLQPVAEATLARAADQDAKSRLQEWSQGDRRVTPHYEIVSEKGPDHAKVFEAQVLLDEQVVGWGSGRSKQAAEQAAAKSALDALVQDADAGEVFETD